MIESRYPEEKRMIEMYESCIASADELDIEVIMGSRGFDLTVDGKERAYTVPNLDELDTFFCAFRAGRQAKKVGGPGA